MHVDAIIHLRKANKKRQQSGFGFFGVFAENSKPETVERPLLAFLKTIRDQHRKFFEKNLLIRFRQGANQQSSPDQKFLIKPFIRFGQTGLDIIKKVIGTPATQSAFDKGSDFFTVRRHTTLSI